MYRDFTHPASHLQQVRYQNSATGGSSRSLAVRQSVGRSLIEIGKWLEGGRPATPRAAANGSV